MRRCSACVAAKAYATPGRYSKANGRAGEGRVPSMPESGVRCGGRTKHDERDGPNRCTAPDADAPRPRVARRAGRVRGACGDRLRPQRRHRRERHPGHVTRGHAARQHQCRGRRHPHRDVRNGSLGRRGLVRRQRRKFLQPGCRRDERLRYVRRPDGHLLCFRQHRPRQPGHDYRHPSSRHVEGGQRQ